MRGEQVERLDQLNLEAHQLSGVSQEVRSLHTRRPDLRRRRIGRGFSGTAAIELAGAVKR